MSINPYDSPETAGQAPQRKPGQFRFRLIELLVVVGIIALLVGLLLPAVRTSGEAARRASCGNNLKMIAVALRSYQEVYGVLPPAYTVDAQGQPLHSWRTLILPYCDQNSLYQQIDLSQPWDDPANQAARETKIPAYQCPSAGAPAGHTTYLAVVGPHSCWRAAQPRAPAEITDAHDLTLLVMEVDAKQAVHWMSPADASEAQVISFAAADPLAHRGGAQALFADGSIRFLSKSTKPAALRAMISTAGSDDAVARQAD